MPGTFQLRIGDSEFTEPMRLAFDHLFVQAIRGGVRLRDRRTRQVAVLWDDEITAVVTTGGGATPLSAYLVGQLIHQKFQPAS